MTPRKITHSPEETMDFAQNFTQGLKGGEVLALTGDFGSGKTTFLKGLAEGLGIKEVITSPTFVILKEYRILRPMIHLGGVSKRLGKFVHIDAYRAETIDDIKSVGIEDFLGRSDVVMAIEWAEKIREILPKNTIYINFKHLDEHKREISLNLAPAKKRDKRDAIYNKII